MRRPRPVLAAIAAAAVLTLAACGSSSGSSGSTSPSSSSSSSVSGSITVFAAASLKESFGALGKAFEAANPGTTVTFNFGASSTLATQITQGAPADVFASASTKTMDTVTAAGAASDPTTFAVNTMEIATPNPQKVPVSALADLASASVKTVVCQKDVPCGAAAVKLFECEAIRKRCRVVSFCFVCALATPKATSSTVRCPWSTASATPGRSVARIWNSSQRGM